MWKIIKKNIKSDNGFMGPTHSMSSIALYLLLFLFCKPLLLYLGLSDNIIILFLTSIVIAGTALLPDLDNVRSTALSVLGPLGQLLSTLMRSTSTAIFYMTRTKYDDKQADPHRGFWHTLVSGFLLGFIVKLLVSMKFNISSPLSNYGFNELSDFLAFFWIFISVQLAFSGLMNTTVKKHNKSFIGKLTLNIIAITISLILVYYNSSDNYNWLVWCIVLGYTFHILGDTLTVSGTPLLFPLKFKGKRWFTHRLMKLRAGGEFEKVFLLPLFTIIVGICTVLILTGGL